MDHHHISKAIQHNLRKGIRILGSQVCLVATDWYADSKIKAAITIWETATARIQDLTTFVLQYQEHVARTLQHQSQTKFPANDKIQQWETSVGRIVRQQLHCVPTLSETKLWDPQFMKVIQFNRVHNICRRAAMHALLTTLNTNRQDLACWARYRWQLQNPHPSTHEARLSS